MTRPHAAVLAALLVSGCSPWGCCWRMRYEADFEAGPWEAFEEVVTEIRGGEVLPVPCRAADGTPVLDESGNEVPAYALGAGVVTRSSEAKRSGQYGLLVHANAHALTRSNHIMGHQQVFGSFRAGRWRYEVDFMIPHLPDDSEFVGQLGPELSIQNGQRGDSGEVTTYVAGVQYVSNPHPDEPWSHKWAVWQGGWVLLPDFDFEPSPGKWYELRLEVDFSAKHYERIRVVGENTGVQQSLESYDLVAEDRSWEEEAFWLTLEAENQWTNCDRITRFRVAYDDVKLSERRKKPRFWPSWLWPCD